MQLPERCLTAIHAFKAGKLRSRCLQIVPKAAVYIFLTMFSYLKETGYALSPELSQWYMRLFRPD
ncbi:hypothetical protein C1T17_01260 [Sphingobium sp. SCG-1]|nr:hypothetical protein C1T17_01260 [Sphingobium sp. SCG-1]